MIDLHAHILPGLDDGSPDVGESLAMARVAATDGIRVLACTPHVVPGLYENDRATISASVETFRERLRDEGIELDICIGADIHVAPAIVERLRQKEVPTLNNSRYFLLEPTHHVLPPRLEHLIGRLIEAGFGPILTHPERLTWIKSHYQVIERINSMGCLMQVTAASLSGRFGKTALYYAERLLDEGRVDLLASDCHDARRRPPVLSEARDIVETRLGASEARRMVFDCPAAILRDQPVVAVGADRLRPDAPAEKKTVAALVGRFLRGREDD